MSVLMDVVLAIAMVGIGAFMATIFAILFVRDWRAHCARSLILGTVVMCALSLVLVAAGVVIIASIANVTLGGAPWLL